MGEQNIYKVKENGESDKAELNYAELCSSKIDEAKELLIKGNADGYAALNTAEYYAKKANIEVPREIEKLKPIAHKVFADYNFKGAKETLETDPDGSIASLLLAEKHAILANIQLPADFESVKNKAYNNGINAKIKDAEEAIKTNDYKGAIRQLSVAKSYAEKIKVPVPAKVEELIKGVYLSSIYLKINKAKELLNKGDIGGYDFLIFAESCAEAYAKKANIPVPEEIEKLKLKAHEVFANYKYNAAKETLETDPGDSVVNLLLTEKHTKLANVPLPADFESVKNKAYTNCKNAMIKDALRITPYPEDACNNFGRMFGDNNM